MAKITNKEKIKGTLSDAIVGADVFLGLSVAGALKPEMVKTMAADSIVFAMANPTPEIMPDEAKAAGARIIATGRSDFQPGQQLSRFPRYLQRSSKGKSKSNQ